MQFDALIFVGIRKVQMKTLNVKPSVLLQVEELAVLLIDFSVTVRPNAGLLNLKKRMHPRPEKISVVLFKKTRNLQHALLYDALEELRRLEGFISFQLHDV